MLYDNHSCVILKPFSMDGFYAMRSEESRMNSRKGKPFEASLVPSETSDCILWTGKTDKDGYGRRGVEIGEKRAHRYAYFLKHGPIPTGVLIRHTCDTPSCCNPDHLVPGTQGQNIQDKVLRNRQAKGSSIGKAKLTEDMVREIRELYRNGMTQKEISAKFPVTQSSVSLIVMRKQWTHI